MIAAVPTIRHLYPRRHPHLHPHRPHTHRPANGAPACRAATSGLAAWTECGCLGAMAEEGVHRRCVGRRPCCNEYKSRHFAKGVMRTSTPARRGCASPPATSGCTRTAPAPLTSAKASATTPPMNMPSAITSEAMHSVHAAATRKQCRHQTDQYRFTNDLQHSASVKVMPKHLDHFYSSCSFTRRTTRSIANHLLQPILGRSVAEHTPKG